MVWCGIMLCGVVCGWYCMVCYYVSSIMSVLYLVICVVWYDMFGIVWNKKTEIICHYVWCGIMCD